MPGVIARCHNCSLVTVFEEIGDRWRCTNCLILVESVQVSIGERVRRGSR